MDGTVMVTLPTGDTIAACAHHLRVTCDTCGVGISPSPLLPYVVKRLVRNCVLDRVLDEYNDLAGFPDSHLPMAFDHPKKDTAEPLMLFSPINNRFVNNNNPFEILIFADGACSSNGTPEAAGGCGFSYADGIAVKFRLGDRGPDDQPYRPISNRAELRAALAALNFCHWEMDGSKSVVIATDSTYVVKGATEWSHAWTENGWRGRASQVKNQDLWKAMLDRVEQLHLKGFWVQFWWIPWKWNEVADRAAKQATTEKAREHYFDVRGILM